MGILNVDGECRGGNNAGENSGLYRGKSAGCIWDIEGGHNPWVSGI